MRQEIDAQLYLNFSEPASLKVVKEYRLKYEGVSKLLDSNKEILQLVHEDISKSLGSSSKGRKGKYTTENILRALIVHNIEGTDWRESIVRISESEFLKEFIRFGNREVMDYSFLCKCFKAIEPETWKKINEALGNHAIDNDKIDPSELRVDTTVVESNIHYPTDASLLWDSYRVLCRILRQIRKEEPSICPHRFHEKKIRKLYLFIVRYINSGSKKRKRQVNIRFKELISAVERVLEISEEVSRKARARGDIILHGYALDMEVYFASITTVIETSRRVVYARESVKADERVYSIFEPHAELIKRGKKNKAVEFGHKILLCQTKDKFITDYDVMEKQRADSELLGPILENHKEQFAEYPKVVAGDGGFCTKLEEMKKHGKNVDTLAIPRKVSDWGSDLLQPWQNFRAGIEGSISVLKRGFRLVLCYYRGFKSFAASVGMAIFCHNLVQLSHKPTK